MDKLSELVSRCKCGVVVSVNDHRPGYITAADYLDTLAIGSDVLDDVSPDVKATMIATDTIVSVQFCPDNPVSFYHVLHHDLDAALTAALECLNQSAEQ